MGYDALFDNTPRGEWVLTTADKSECLEMLIDIHLEKDKLDFTSIFFLKMHYFVRGKTRRLRASYTTVVAMAFSGG